ncbi:hypothetical protein EON65_32560 [archaeon]|nr:MAG: hypothetical protein EON65_32560 [archaeon]
MGSFDGWLDGGCFPFNLQDIFDDDFNDDYLANVTYASYLTDYSNEYYFLGPNCTGNVIGVSSMDKLVKKCSPADDAYYYYDDDADADDDDDNTAADDDDVDDDYVGIEWTGYTSALTCTVPDNTNCNPSSSDDDGLSDGAVAGAVVGSVAGVALIGGGVFLVAKGGLFGSGGGMAAAQAGTAADAAANSAL